METLNGEKIVEQGEGEREIRLGCKMEKHLACIN